MNSQKLCLVKNLKKNIRCDRCDILLDLRIWKNKKIALSINKKKRYGFICVKCILASKDHPTFYRTKKQLDEFVKKLRSNY